MWGGEEQGRAGGGQRRAGSWEAGRETCSEKVLELEVVKMRVIW